MNLVSPSSHPGMGAIPFDGGTGFRVWAPNADQVSVAGTFNSWSVTANPFANEGHGFWSADVPGAGEGDEYRFIIRTGAQEFKRIDPYARHVTNSAGNAVVYDPAFDWGTETFQAPTWNELVIYEMHVGTFNDQPEGPPGNLNKAIDKFPYLHALGVNAIQVMPSMEFAGGFSWGYNPANIFAIESDYGGPAAFKAFVKAAHENGLAVIFDVVYNHLGPSDLDLWKFDGWSQNGKGGIFFYNDWRSTTPWGDTRPDYSRGEVRQYLRDNALVWLEEFRADGLRWDATAWIRNVYGNNDDPSNDLPDGWSLMQWINAEVDERQSWKISIAEDLRDNPWITRKPGAGGAGFDSQWDAGFVHPLRKTLIAPGDEARDMFAIRKAITHHYNGDAFQRVIYTESHDEVANGHARLPEEIWPGNAGSWHSKKRSTLGAALVFTSPGIPMIFQGQEFLEDQWFHDQDPIDWSKAVRYSGILRLYLDLIQLRRNWFDTTRGLRGQGVHVHHINDSDKVIAFHRWENGGPRDDVMVATNFGNKSYESYNLGFPGPGLWKVRFNSDWEGYDPEFGNHFSYDTVSEWGVKDHMPCRANVGLGPYSAIILSQDE